MSARCAHDPAGVVGRQPLFASLSEAECSGLVARSVCRSVRRNELLFREGEPCREDCGGKVKRIVQGGRSTFFCPSCQR